MLVLKVCYDELVKQKEIYDEQNTARKNGDEELIVKGNGLGATIGIIILILALFIFAIFLYIWAIYAIVKYWSCVHIGIAIAAVVCLFTIGPVFSLIFMYAASDSVDRASGCKFSIAKKEQEELNKKTVYMQSY